MNLGPAEMIILVGILVLLVLPVWAIVDALQATEAQWEAIGQQRTLWLVLIAAGTLCGGLIGTILAIVYLATVRPKLRTAQA